MVESFANYRLVKEALCALALGFVLRKRLVSDCIDILCLVIGETRINDRRKIGFLSFLWFLCKSTRGDVKYIVVSAPT